MPKKIVVINDSAEILELFEDILTEAGYTVSVQAYSTRDIAKIKAEQPDLIVSDHVPTQEIVGWQFLQKLRMTKETAKIPVIICTTNRNVVHRIEARLEEKGVIVVLKPFELEDLLEAVETMIGKADEPGFSKTSLNPQAPH